MKNKITKILLLVFLVLIGVSMVFGQTGFRNRSLNITTVLGDDSTFRANTYLGPFSSYSAPGGFDTVTYTGITNLASFVIRGSYWTNTHETNPSGKNITEFGTALGSNKYIRLDLAAPGGTGNTRVLKGGNTLYDGDTIYFTFNSTSSNNRKRFRFDTSKAVRIYTASQGDSYANNYVPKFHMLKLNGTGANVKTSGTYNVFDGLSMTDASGITYANYSPGRGSINPGSNWVKLQGYHPDTMAFVIDSVINNQTFPYMYFSDFYVQSCDSLLQGRNVGIQDTLILIIAHGPNATGVQNARAPISVQQTSGTQSEYGMFQAAGGRTNLGVAQAASFANTATTFGGAPLVLFTLLPGAANFVRWNVGIDPEWGYTGVPAGRFNNGYVVPTVRRQHVRVRDNVIYPGSADIEAFRTTDTATILNIGFVANNRVRDTLYIFDRDSNLTLDTTGGVVVSSFNAIGGIIAKDSNFAPFTEPFGLKMYPQSNSRRGTIVYDWQLRIIENPWWVTVPSLNLDSSFRISKVRLATNGTNALGVLLSSQDTLNNKTPLTYTPNGGVYPPVGNLGYYASGTAGATYTNYSDSCILFRAGRASIANLWYKKESSGGTDWKLWSSQTGGIPISSSEASSSLSDKHMIKAVVTDTFGNAVDNAIIGFKSDLSFTTWWDTISQTYGYGTRVDYPSGLTTVAGDYQTPSSIPGTDTVVMYIRNRGTQATDDRGVAGLLFSYSDKCFDTSNFSFWIYDHVKPLGDADTTNKPFNSYFKVYQGGNYFTYGESSLEPTYLLVGGKFNGNTIVKTSAGLDTVSTSTVDMLNTTVLPYGMYRNIDTVTVSVWDECNRPVTITSTSLADYSFANVKPRTKIGYTAKASPQDTLGSYVNSKWFHDINKISMEFKVPNVPFDTISLIGFYNQPASMTFGDSLLLYTFSGPPETLSLERPTGGQDVLTTHTGKSAAANPLDSILVASNFELYKGVVGTYNTASYGVIGNGYPNTWTFVKGVGKDINGDSVTSASVAGKKAIWRLLGTSPYSMGLADPNEIFTTLPNVAPSFNLQAIEAVPLVGPKLGYRELELGASNDGNFYVALVSGNVGGNNWASHHVFPIERGTTFPTGTYNTANDLLTSTYPWTGSTSGVDIPHTYRVSDGAYITDADNATNYNQSYALTSFTTDTTHGRGFNKLIAIFGHGNKTTVTTGNNRPLIYNVIPDTARDLRIAWLDMSKQTTFDATTGADERPELKGRQTATIMNVYVNPMSSQTSFRRLALGGNNTNSTLTLNEGLNFPGRINQLYLREYDRFGNPVSRWRYADSVVVKILAHTKKKSGFSTAATTPFTPNNRFTETVTPKYYKWSGTALANRVGYFRDSSGVFVDRSVAAMTSAPYPTQMPVLPTDNAATHYSEYLAQSNNLYMVGYDVNSKTGSLQQLRGAIGVKYQTLWMDGGTLKANPRDTVWFEAYRNSGAATPVADTAAVISDSIPDVFPLTPYYTGVPNKPHVTGDTTHVLRNFFATCTDGTTSYPMPWFDMSFLTSSKFPWTNQFQLRIDPTTTTNMLDQGYRLSGDAPIYDMPSFGANSFAFIQVNEPLFKKSGSSNSINSVSADGAYGTIYGTGSELRFRASSPDSNWKSGGWLSSSDATFKFRALRTGKYQLQVYSPSTGYGVSKSEGIPVLSYYANGFHFVSMTNPNTEHKDLEPTSTQFSTSKYMWPLLPKYFTNGGHWNPDKLYNVEGIPGRYDSLGQFNGEYSDAYNINAPNNIRKYSPPVDTVFYGDKYYLELRPYDRFGNIIKLPRVWLSNTFATKDDPFPSTNVWTNKANVAVGTANEWEFKIDTNNIPQLNTYMKDSLKYADTLIIKFIKDANTPSAVAGRIQLAYSPSSQNASLKDSLPVIFHAGHDLDRSTDRLVAYRDIYVKELKAPAKFDLVTDKLVRIDNDVVNYAPKWNTTGANLNTNLVEDSIVFALHVVDANTNTELANYPLGRALTKVFTTAELKKDLGLGDDTKKYNRDIKLYVVATNKWASALRPVENTTTTTDQSAVVTVEYNKIPSFAVIVAPEPNYVKVIDPTKSTNTFILNWHPAVDLNGSYDRYNGSFVTDGELTQPVTYYGTTYPNDYSAIDTMFYTVNLTRTGLFPSTSTSTFTSPKDTILGPATALGAAVRDTVLTLTDAMLKQMLGDADSATYTWTVTAFDRAGLTGNGTATTVRSFVITKIDATYNVLVETPKRLADNRTAAPVDLKVDYFAPIKLVAIDATGDTIKGFNNFTKVSSTTTDSILVTVAGASTTRNELQYVDLVKDTTIARVASRAIAVSGVGYKFKVPVAWFVNGVAQVYLRDTKASEQIRLVIAKEDQPVLLKQVDGKGIQVSVIMSDTSIWYNTIPGSVASIITTVTPRRGTNPGVVFLLKTMETIITPADKYRNEIVKLPEGQSVNILLQITPPDDILEGNLVGARIITGRTYLYLHPTIVHDIADYNPLLIGAYLPVTGTNLPDATTGKDAKVLVVNHAPKPGKLGDVVNLQTNTPIANNLLPLKTWSDKFEFRWTAAVDTNDAALVKSDAPNKLDKRFWIEDQCVPKYTLKFKEYTTLTISDSIETDTKVLITGGQLLTVFLNTRTGVSKNDTVHWYVIVEDEIYKYTNPVYTSLLKSEEKILVLVNDGITSTEIAKGIPTTYGLDQNYPNPFNPSTTISYSLPKESNVKLVIYNILGQPVRTLVNDRQTANYYTLTWDGKNDNGLAVSSGSYIYRITADDFLATKKMNLLK